jgi:hypothetical protein
MSGREHLLNLADTYCSVVQLPRTTVSFRLFNDSKRLDAVANGKDILLGSYERAVRYFAENWPAGADWPEGVPRPAVKHAPRAEQAVA